MSSNNDKSHLLISRLIKSLDSSRCKLGTNWPCLVLSLGEGGERVKYVQHFSGAPHQVNVEILILFSINRMVLLFQQSLLVFGFAADCKFRSGPKFADLTCSQRCRVSNSGKLVWRSCAAQDQNGRPHNNLVAKLCSSDRSNGARDKFSASVKLPEQKTAPCHAPRSALVDASC